MPVRPLPSDPNLDHLKYQAKDLLKAHGARDAGAAQRIREFHPRFHKAADVAIFSARLKLSDAQLTIAREHGYASWPRLRQRIEKPTPADGPDHIQNATFRQAVDLLDAGDVEGLHKHLREHPRLVHQHVSFEGVNYFRNPTLLEFVAENPVRRGALPANIVQVAQVILDAGAKQDQPALNETLALVCSGCVPRQCNMQIPLIDLLCDHGADPSHATPAALAHGESDAVRALLRRGARKGLAEAAALGAVEDAQQLLPRAGGEVRHRALTLASQFGHAAIVQLLLDAGEDPNRYNPIGFHSHSTPLHQAVAAGHGAVVRLLVERGARLDLKDTLWQGTPLGWASHEGKAEIEEYLRAQETRREGASGSKM